MSFLRMTLCCSLLALTTHSYAIDKIEQTIHICAVQGTPSHPTYKIVKRIKVGKGTYGSVEDLYPKVKSIANQYQADAIINYNASQRFGFWPWHFVRPVITGTAIKFEAPIDCASINGKII